MATAAELASTHNVKRGVRWAIVAVVVIMAVMNVFISSATTGKDSMIGKETATMHVTRRSNRTTKKKRDLAIIHEKTDKRSLISSPRGGGKFAYAFIISGCTGATSCTGYILNIIAAAQVLRNSNSTADIVLQVRMAAHDNSTRLPLEQQEWLKKSRVRLRYLPKVSRDNFGVATMEKFRVLEMTEYDRVIFMDSDILPLCNMDYMFHESFSGQLSENVAVSGSVAPATASFFLVTPQEGEFARVLEIVHRHRCRRATRFNTTVGWGHVMDPNDKWESWQESGHLWNFFAATSDQGLLYHWLKYELLNYTHIHLGKTDTWREVTGNVDYWRKQAVPVFGVKDNRFIAKVRSEFVDLRGCGGPKLNRRGAYAKIPPFRDFYHFAGGGKPWNQPIVAQDVPSNYSSAVKGRDVWMYWLGEANRTLELRLPSRIETAKGNPLGGADAPDHLLANDIELPVPR